MPVTKKPIYDLKAGLLDSIRQFGQADGNDSKPWAMIKGGLSGAAESAANLFVPGNDDQIPAGVMPPIIGNTSEAVRKPLSAFKPKAPMPSDRRMDELVGKFSTGKPPVTVELPMDQASRMSRAAEQGYTTPVYHGTTHTFDVFDDPIRGGGYGAADFGHHVGDINAANVRSGSNTITGGDDIEPTEVGAQVLPLLAKMNKTLQLPDMGIWKNPSNYIRKHQQMLDGDHTTFGHSVNEQVSDPAFLGRLANEAASLRNRMLNTPNRRAEAGFNDEKLMTAWQHKMRELMQDEGYDSIKYKNYTEGDGADSYLLLDPRQLRSQFAKFDPARANSRDLMASLAASLGIPQLMKAHDDPEQ